MIILDKPFVSQFLIETAKKYNYPVLGNSIVHEMQLNNSLNIISEEEARSNLLSDKNPSIYTNSENSLEWIINNLSGHKLSRQINLFKDKFKFRKLIQSLYPGFFYRELNLDEIDNLDINNIPKPFVVKPTVGFFSIGVKIIFPGDDWDAAKRYIVSEIKKFEQSYPDQVLSTTKLIIEEYIEGEEYAFDAYYNTEGKPIILNIFKHLYSSGTDTRDRVYLSSKEVVENNLNQFEKFLADVGRLAGLRNFPLHTEVRITKDGSVIPIEINPLRFGGWCTTADATYFAYGINSYQYYFEGKAPALPDRQAGWRQVFEGKEDYLYSVIVLDNSTGIPSGDIAAFDYEKLLSKFEHPLELRKTDYKNFHVFGFLFTETHKNNFAELEYILNSDLKEFIL